MTPEQQLIQQIKQLLASPQLEKQSSLEDVAGQFAELCESANNRLARCADYLDKGMRSEAVNEAHNLPDLLALADLLEFDGIKKWQNLCLDMELSLFQPLNKPFLERLKEAVAREKELEPLLREYRRCVYQGDKRRCIELLRKIRKKDPDNPSWKSNLKPLEEEAMPVLIAQTESALADGDLIRLKQLYAELTHPQRAAMPTDDIMRRVRRALMSERAADLRDEADSVLVNLREAVKASDCPQTEILLEQADKLSGDEAFLDKPAGWDATLKDARELLAAQVKRRGRQAEFLAAVETLQNMLSKGTFTEMELRHEWERLLAWEMPVSELLRKQVEETLEELRTARRRRKRAAALIFAALLCVAIVVAAVFAVIGMKKRGRAARLTHIEQLWDDGNFSELDLYLSRIGTEDPIFAQSPEVEAMRRKLKEAMKNTQSARDNLRQLLDKLAALRGSQYDGMDREHTLQLLKDAQSAADTLHDEAATARLKTWRSEWEEWCRRRSLKAGNELKIAVAAVNTACEEAQSKPYTDFEAERAKLASLRNILNAAEPYAAFAADMDRAAFQSARERLDAWEREAHTRSENQDKLDAEIRKLRASIPRSVTDLRKYRAQLERYVAIAPADVDSFARGCRLVLEHFAAYEGALAISSLGTVRLPPDAATADAITKLCAADGAAIATVWEHDLQRALAMRTTDDTLKRRLATLLNANPELLNIYYIRYSPKDSDTWRRLYSPKPLMSGPAPDDNTLKIYWGNVFFAQDPLGTPVLMHTKLAFPGRLNSRDYDIEMEPRKEDNRCEYAKFLFKFITEAAEAKDMPTFILNGIQSLFDNTKIEPVLRALLIKRMLTLLREECADSISGINAIAEIFAPINTNAPWMNEDNPETKAAARQLATAIAKCQPIPELIASIKRNAALLQETLSVNLSCVGSFQLDADGRPSLNLRTSHTPELRAVFTRTGGQPFFLVISNDGTSIKSDAIDKCIPGMPVFAPAPGHDTKTVIERLAITPKELNSLTRPAAWPENAWR